MTQEATPALAELRRRPRPDAQLQPQLLVEEAKRDIEEVHRSVSEAAQRLQQSRAMLEAYLVKMSAERPIGTGLGVRE